MNLENVISLILPFIGTVIGSAFVFLFKNKMSEKVEKIFSGFAAGVMVAATIWSLLLPAFDSAVEIDFFNKGNWISKFAFLPVMIGLVLGFLFLMLLDRIVPHLHINENSPEGLKSNFKKSTMTGLAVALHNFPEGMAVGILIASTTVEGNNVTVFMALALAIGIAVQNLPEGAIISVPLHSSGMKKGKAFLLGVLSGLAEPIGALLTILVAIFAMNFLSFLLPVMLSFAAGAMLYVVVEELIPEMTKGKHSHAGIISFMIGFIIMMILDFILG